jgi:GTP-binding protein Era
MTDVEQAQHRSGFATFVGRPNAGKSTLMNAIVGTKLAITSDRPQTTRRTIRGIVNRDDGQLIIVDTPGMHRPRTLLGERLNDQVHETLADVDVIGLCLPATEDIGPGDRFIAEQIAKSKAIKFAIITKTDTANPDRVAEQLMQAQALADQLGIEFTQIVPVSASTGSNVPLLTDLLVDALPAGPSLYPDDEVTDEPIDITIAEYIREAALKEAREELPHSIAVVVEEIVPREDRPEGKPLTDVRADIYVERDSQKAIVIGKKGSRLREIGATSRPHIERLLGTPVFLDLHVKLAKDWQKDPKQLRRLGF